MWLYSIYHIIITILCLLVLLRSCRFKWHPQVPVADEFFDSCFQNMRNEYKTLLNSGKKDDIKPHKQMDGFQQAVSRLTCCIHLLSEYVKEMDEHQPDQRCFLAWYYSYCCCAITYITSHIIYVSNNMQQLWMIFNIMTVLCDLVIVIALTVILYSLRSVLICLLFHVVVLQLFIMLSYAVQPMRC